MTAFGERIQALMDEVYTEWRKEENNRKIKWDILGGFSAAHQIAIVFGNFNYQVGNGGIEQWIYNGYFHDDAEKFIEYLEIGAKSDERCRTILDRIYQLDQYAQETDCDRDGYFNEEDGESGFIGDMMNCDEFDTWYYDKCDGDNWWQVVCEIIDKVEGRESALVRQDEHDDEITAATHLPLRVYIENACNDQFGGFTMPLPTTQKDISLFFEQIGITDPRDIAILDVRSDIKGLAKAVKEAINRPISPDTLNELNYLSAKIAAMKPMEHEIFAAALEAKRHCGSIAELINLTENLDRFDLEPAFDTAMLGEHLVDIDADTYSAGIQKLYESKDEELRGVINYIEILEKHVDYTAYGKEYAENEQGVFTDHGYLTERDGFKEIYRGPGDIPPEYRALAHPEPEKPERQSVLERIAADRAERAAAPKRNTPEKAKSRGQEL